MPPETIQRITTIVNFLMLHCDHKILISYACYPDFILHTNHKPLHSKKSERLYNQLLLLFIKKAYNLFPCKIHAPLQH